MSKINRCLICHQSGQEYYDNKWLYCRCCDEHATVHRSCQRTMPDLWPLNDNGDLQFCPFCPDSEQKQVEKPLEKPDMYYHLDAVIDFIANDKAFDDIRERLTKLRDAAEYNAEPPKSKSEQE